LHCPKLDNNRKQLELLLFIIIKAIVVVGTQLDSVYSNAIIVCRCKSSSHFIFDKINLRNIHLHPRNLNGESHKTFLHAALTHFPPLCSRRSKIMQHFSHYIPHKKRREGSECVYEKAILSLFFIHSCCRSSLYFCMQAGERRRKEKFDKREREK
jgi:hypothetical protein